METPTELLIDEPHTDAELQGNLLQDYEQKFEQRPEDQKLSKLCRDVGLKIVEKKQLFITIEEEGPDEMKNLCREFSLLRSEKASRVRGWIRGKTKIGPVFDAKVCRHQERYGIEVMVESLFRDRTVSRVRIVNGINKYVTETSKTISLESVEHRVTGKLVVKAKPRLKFAVTLSPVSIPVRERKWIDIDPKPFNEVCFAVSKFMIRLLRHDKNITREDDGAVRFDDLIEEFKVKFVGTSEWTVDAWTTFLAKGGGPKKRFQYCLNPNSSNCIARQCTVARGLHRVHLPHRERLRDALHKTKWSDPRRKRQQKGQTISVLHSREPDGHSTWSKRSGTRSG